MRLAIVNLTGGGFSAGYIKYLKNMLPRLADHTDVDELLCISPAENDIPGCFKKQSVVNYRSCRSFSLKHLIRLPDKKMAEYLKEFSPDIIFLPVGRHIKFSNVPVVNMIQNMEPFLPHMKGDTLQERYKKFILRILARNSIRRVSHTIAISSFVRDYLASILRVPENRISLAYHGVTPSINGICLRPDSIPIGWDGSFLFTCGSVRPARGLEDAFDALDYLKLRNIDARLVVAGETVPGMKRYREYLERLLLSRGLADNVCWAGRLNDEEIGWCYARCQLFLMTSRVEACPNIALEAMSYGCISISTDSFPMPEIFGDAAVYYSQRDGKDLSSVIETLLAWNKEQKKELSERAKERATYFSWDICVEKTVEALKKTLLFNRDKRAKGR